MKGPFLAADGARFSARIQNTVERPQASFLVACDVADAALTETDIQCFASDEDAVAWLDLHAAKRGFEKYPIARD